jgi:hypothetical protein
MVRLLPDYSMCPTHADALVIGPAVRLVIARESRYSDIGIAGGPF